MDILNQFGIDPILLAAQVVNFLILLFILKRLLYKPILKVLAERQKKIADSLKNAEEIEKRLVQVTEDRERQIQKSIAEGEKIIKEATEEAAKIIADARDEAEILSAKTLARAQVELKQHRMNLEQAVRENIADIILLVLQKVSGKILTRCDQKKIVEESIRSLTPSN